MLSLCVMSFDRHIWILSLVFLFALASCAEKDSPVENSCPIEFSVADFSAEVRGSELTTDNMSSFGVFAALEDNSQHDFEGIEVSELELFMDDVPVTNVDGSWTANPPHYWPILNDKSLSFFAYAPHSEGTGIVATAGWEQGNGTPEKTVKITYTLDPNPAAHLDLCVAKAVLDRVPDTDGNGEADPVTFEFEHTLSWVSFAANYVGDLPEGCVLKIDELSLRNIAASGNLNMNSSQTDGSFFSWDEITDDDKTASVTLSVIGETLDGNVPLPEINQENDNHVNFATAKGALFVMPQTVNYPDVRVPALMELTFSYIRSQDSAVIAQFYTQIQLPESEWVVAKRTKYVFTVDVTTASLIKISAVSGQPWIEDWQDAGNSHDDVTIK